MGRVPSGVGACVASAGRVPEWGRPYHVGPFELGFVLETFQFGVLHLLVEFEALPGGAVVLDEVEARHVVLDFHSAVGLGELGQDRVPF